MKLLLGIDVGTSGLKCVLMNEEGTILATAGGDYPLFTPQPAWSEQNPEDWWDATRKALHEVTAQMPSDGEIAGIGLCGQMHGLVALAEDGSVVRPAILWNDQRTGEQCSEIIEEAGGIDGLVSATNNTMLTGYTGGKILWVKENEPENYARIHKFVMPKDYIRYRLTGKTATDVSDASGTGFFDVRSSTWADGLLERLDIDISIFPDVVESDAVSGYVTDKAAEETGLAPGIPVYGGGGDAVLQNAGMGIVKEGTLGVVLGTSGVVATPLKNFADNAGGRLQFFRSNEAGSYMVFGCQLSCAGSMEWFKNLVYQDTPDALAVINREAEESPIGSNGISFLPYLSGERCPHPNPDARGVFYGLSLIDKRGDLGRAVMEGVTFGLREIYALMQEADPSLKVHQILISGGGSKSALWKQIVADIFNLPVKVLSGAGEGGAYGAALVAGIGAGIFDSLAATEKMHKTVEVIEPDSAAHAAYEKPYALYRQLYKDLVKTYSEFA